MPSTNKPCDLLFKYTMGSDVALKDFLRVYLSKSLHQRIDLETIQPTKQFYVPPQLRELHSDLVYTCKIDGQQALHTFLRRHLPRLVYTILSS